MGVIVAYLLLFMEEEDAFWTMITILEDMMPATYYTAQLTGKVISLNKCRKMSHMFIQGVSFKT